MQRFTYTFGCQTCSKSYRSDDPGEPCCTGPSETRDDHPMEVMRLLRIDREDVNPLRAERRAAGELLLPSADAVKLAHDARILIAG